MEAIEAFITSPAQEDIPEKKVIETGRYEPSGGNNQITHFIVFFR